MGNKLIVKTNKTNKTNLLDERRRKKNWSSQPQRFLDIIQYQYPFWQIDCLLHKNKPTIHYCEKRIKENAKWAANAKWAENAKWAANATL